MKKLVMAIVVTASIGCAHGIRNLEDCGSVSALDRKAECGLCTAQNKAGGALGTYEYRPDNSDGQRCVRIN
jgi:hypothetical protein